MDETIRLIIAELKRGEALDGHRLDRMLRDANRKRHDSSRHIAKRRLLPFYLKERNSNSDLFKSWEVDEALDDALVSLLRAKPRRTASGVATVTVLTKPWPCSGDCVYCPSDIRMPKSYLANEPACQRAERCGFDPYAQVMARLRVLADMGHNIDKVELIVLGGTWSEYAEGYQRWFIKELFRALNDFGDDCVNKGEDADSVSRFFSATDMPDQSKQVEEANAFQQRIDSGDLDYNQAVMRLYEDDAPECTWEELEREHARNEHAKHRNVGLVIETRPDRVTDKHLRDLRHLGCTKIQLGIQSLTPEVLALNSRTACLEDVERAMSLLRLRGFKSHVHFMVNLLGATSASDFRDFRTLVSDPRFMPDEIKLYPCALVKSSRLTNAYRTGEWLPYSEDELVDLLVQCVCMTPAFTRISRMIRDISSCDIMAGNKKTNLRQMVEDKIEQSGSPVNEMRMREVGTGELNPDDLRLEVVEYETTNTSELFLQYVDSDDRLASFLRLSLPKHKDEAAMIREVHVYGRVSRLHEQKEGAQHIGLGRSLVEEACRISQLRNRTQIKVISAVGTREYYRTLGFSDAGLYQSRDLIAHPASDGRGYANA